MYVRIKPYNKRKNHLMRRYTSLAHGIRMRGDRGWHTITNEDHIDHLREVCQNGNTVDENDTLNIDSPLAFDLAETKEEAKRIEARAEAAEGKVDRQEVGTIDAPVRASRADRPGRKKKGSKARTRKAREPEVSKGPPAELTADEIADARNTAIETLVDGNSAKQLRAMAKKAEIEIPTGSDKAAVAALIVDDAVFADDE